MRAEPASGAPAAPPGSRAVAGEGPAGRGAERPHEDAAASAPPAADVDGGDADLQGGLTWSGDLDALGSLHSPSLAAWLDVVRAPALTGAAPAKLEMCCQKVNFR